MTLATFYSLYTALKQDQYISFFDTCKNFYSASLVNS